MASRSFCVKKVAAFTCGLSGGCTESGYYARGRRVSQKWGRLRPHVWWVHGKRLRLLVTWKARAGARGKGGREGQVGKRDEGVPFSRRRILQMVLLSWGVFGASQWNTLSGLALEQAWESAPDGPLRILPEHCRHRLVGVSAPPRVTPWMLARSRETRDEKVHFFTTVTLCIGHTGQLLGWARRRERMCGPRTDVFFALSNAKHDNSPKVRKCCERMLTPVIDKTRNDYECKALSV